MDILFEIVAAVLQLIGEFLLQAVFEVLAELGMHSIKEVFHRPAPTNAFLAAFGYFLIGAGAGGLSLYFVPATLIHHAAARIANLLLTPLASGFLMTLLGAWRRRRDQEPIRLDRFGYAFLFALSMAVVRFIWASRT